VLIDTQRCQGKEQAAALRAFEQAKGYHDAARRMLIEGKPAVAAERIHAAMRRIATAAAQIAQSCAAGQQSIVPAKLAVTPDDEAGGGELTMARYADWESIPMAEGGKGPVWPLPTVKPKFATWSLGGGRPSACAQDKCERWHAGVDLTGAPQGALVIAPEDALIVGLDKGWTDGTRAIFLRTDSNLFLVLGGVIAGSHKEFGLTTGGRVRRGEKLGRIVGSYGMLHFETYAATPDRTANSRWWKDDPPPEGLLNPINYIERMIGADASLLQSRQRLQALKDLGHYTGDVGAAWNDAATRRSRRPRPPSASRPMASGAPPPRTRSRRRSSPPVRRASARPRARTPARPERRAGRCASSAA
jgi:hypothetical protein